MRDEQFREILGFFGLSWEGYRRVRRGVKKRLLAHMLVLDSRSVKQYLERMDRDSAEREEAERLMTVSISRFFRDISLWQALEREVLPERIRREEGTIRVWSAGCACGEEAYSLKMVWHTLGLRSRILPELDLWATDANPTLLEKAQEGIYGPSSLKEVPEKLRTAFFRRRPGENRFALAGFLKAGIQWRAHDLVREAPPAMGFHLVFLRNSLLTYYEERLRAPAFRRIVSALRPGGTLIIGKKEQLPQEFESLVPLATCPYAFEKVE